jgi:hypothetical protein
MFASPLRQLHGRHAKPFAIAVTAIFFVVAPLPVHVTSRVCLTARTHPQDKQPLRIIALLLLLSVNMGLKSLVTGAHGRYTKLGFAGNTEPQYIFPSSEEPLPSPSRPAPPLPIVIQLACSAMRRFLRAAGKFDRGHCSLEPGHQRRIKFVPLPKLSAFARPFLARRAHYC